MRAPNYARRTRNANNINVPADGDVGGQGDLLLGRLEDRVAHDAQLLAGVLGVRVVGDA